MIKKMMKINGERGGAAKVVEVEVIEKTRTGYLVRYNGKMATLSNGGTLSRMSGTHYTVLLTNCIISD